MHVAWHYIMTIIKKNPPKTCLLSCTCRTGAIDAVELSDRFFSIFAAAAAPVTDELFVQMALLLPQADRRLQLLKLARNVSGCVVGFDCCQPDKMAWSLSNLVRQWYIFW